MRVRKHFKVAIPELDRDKFDELYTILRVSLCHGNLSQAAKLLAITRVTAIRWIDHPPQQYYWNDLLIRIITQTARTMISGPNKIHQQYGHRALKEVSAHITLDKDLMEYDPGINSAVRRHVLYLLGEHGQVSSRMLRKARYSGGYSQRTLREALKSLELDRETRGFGDEKVTYYRLPQSSE